MDSNDDQCCSASLAKKRKLDTEERIKIAGRIASIHVENFMCHKNLFIEFDVENNNCFYIGGPNGSGKSALFAAINLGLGGCAANNERGHIAGSFIKDGQVSAKLTIELTNEGQNAHPSYGKRISIERRINKTSSKYTIRSISKEGNREKKTIVGEKKELVDNLLMRYNIHLTNPVFWMSQEKCKQFLSDFKPSSMFQLYIEATKLEDIFYSFEERKIAREECVKMTEKKKEEMLAQKNELKKMKEQFIAQKKLADDKELLEKYKWKLLHCPIRDYDLNIAINGRKIQVRHDIVVKAKLEYEENRKARKEVMKEVEKITDEIELHKEDFEELKNIYSTITEKIKKLESEISKLNRAHNYALRSTKSLKEQLEETEKKIREYQTKEDATKEIATKVTKEEENLRRINAEIEKLDGKRKIKEMKDRKKRLEMEMMTKRTRMDLKKVPWVRLQQELERTRKSLFYARATKENSINKYGTKMDAVMKQIEARKKDFKTLPKGPFGKYITLLDRKWELAMELFAGRHAASFLCNSHHDASVLKSIFKQLKIEKWPAITVFAFKGVPYSNLREPSQKLKTLYRNIEISDPDVHNAFIEATSCEKVILMEDNEEARNLMNNDNPPKNVKCTITLDGSQVFPDTAGGQYRFYVSHQIRITHLFCHGVNTSNESELLKEISNKEKLIVVAKKEFLEEQTKYEEARDEVNSMIREINEADLKLENLQKQKLKSERLIEDLNQELRMIRCDELEDLQYSVQLFKESIAEAEEKTGNVKKELDELQKQMKAEQKKKKEADRDRAQFEKENNEFLEKLKAHSAEVDALDLPGDILTHRIKALEEDELKFYHEEAKLKTERDDIIETIAQKKQGMVVPTGEMDPPDLSRFPETDVAKKQLEVLEKAIENAALFVDNNTTLETIKEFKKSIHESRQNYKRLEDHLEEMTAINESRGNAYALLKAKTEDNVCQKFEELLKIRGNLEGFLEFDYEKRTLNINVHSSSEKDVMLAEHDEEDSQRNSDGSPKSKKSRLALKNSLKGLSGGERSFVTSSLLMALWEVINQPFRMMDEFDVFMDMFNRKLVMDLLVEVATKKFPFNQFIFFTPQGIKELDKVDGLQVFELKKL